jgi:hypothetical protein
MIFTPPPLHVAGLNYFNFMHFIRWLNPMIIVPNKLKKIILEQFDIHIKYEYSYLHTCV